MNRFPLKIAAPLAVIALLLNSAGGANPEQGKEIYQRHCESCHGSTGRPDFPDLPNFQRGEGLGRSDLAIADYLRDGAQGHPAYRGLLDESEMLAVVAYIRSLQR